MRLDRAALPPGLRPPGWRRARALEVRVTSGRLGLGVTWVLPFSRHAARVEPPTCVCVLSSDLDRWRWLGAPEPIFMRRGELPLMITTW